MFSKYTLKTPWLDLLHLTPWLDLLHLSIEKGFINQCTNYHQSIIIWRAKFLLVPCGLGLEHFTSLKFGNIQRTLMWFWIKVPSLLFPSKITICVIHGPITWLGLKMCFPLKLILQEDNNALIFSKNNFWIQLHTNLNQTQTPPRNPQMMDICGYIVLTTQLHCVYKCSEDSQLNSIVRNAYKCTNDGEIKSNQIAFILFPPHPSHSWCQPLRHRHAILYNLTPKHPNLHGIDLSIYLYSHIHCYIWLKFRN